MFDVEPIDGFQLFSGALAVATGPILLARGAPAGWSFLLIGAGIFILAALWAIAHPARLGTPAAMHVLLAIAGVVFVGVAIVYLTRAANDLPSLFPGHDGDSENFRVAPGVVTLMLGFVAISRAVASVYLPRASSAPVRRCDRGPG